MRYRALCQCYIEQKWKAQTILVRERGDGENYHAEEEVVEDNKQSLRESEIRALRRQAVQENQALQLGEEFRAQVTEVSPTDNDAKATQNAQEQKNDDKRRLHRRADDDRENFHYHDQKSPQELKASEKTQQKESKSSLIISAFLTKK